MNGTVKWFNNRKGYGFIRGEDGKEIFVHRKDLPEETNLEENDQVEYEIGNTNRGPKAIEIKKSNKNL